MKFKAQVQLNKKCSAVKHNRIKGIPKLDDANDAGTTHLIMFQTLNLVVNVLFVNSIPLIFFP